MRRLQGQEQLALLLSVLAVTSGSVVGLHACDLTAAVATATASIDVTFRVAVAEGAPCGSGSIVAFPSAYEQLLAAVAFARTDPLEAQLRVAALLGYQNDDGSMPWSIPNVNGTCSPVSNLTAHTKTTDSAGHLGEGSTTGARDAAARSAFYPPPSLAVAPPYHSTAVLQVFYALYGNTTLPTATQLAIDFLISSWQPLFAWHSFVVLSRSLSGGEGGGAVTFIASPWESAEPASPTIDTFLSEYAPLYPSQLHISSINASTVQCNANDSTAIPCFNPSGLPSMVREDATWVSESAFVGRWCLDTYASACSSSSTGTDVLASGDTVFRVSTVIDNAIFATASQDLATIALWLQANDAFSATEPQHRSQRLRRGQQTEGRVIDAPVSFVHRHQHSVNSSLALPQSQVGVVNDWNATFFSGYIALLCNSSSSTLASVSTPSASGAAGGVTPTWCYDLYWNVSGGVGTVSSPLPLLSGALALGAINTGTPLHDALLDTLTSSWFWPAPAYPTLSRADALYRSNVSHFGPVWLHMNAYLLTVLSDAPDEVLADLLRRRSSDLVCNIPPPCPSQLGPNSTDTYAAFDSVSGSPLSTSTSATNWRADIGYILMFTLGMPPIPAPYQFHGLQAVLIGMIMELAIVLLAGLTCVGLGWRAISRLRRENAAIVAAQARATQRGGGEGVGGTHYWRRGEKGMEAAATGSGRYSALPGRGGGGGDGDTDTLLQAQGTTGGLDASSSRSSSVGVGAASVVGSLNGGSRRTRDAYDTRTATSGFMSAVSTPHAYPALAPGSTIHHQSSIPVPAFGGEGGGGAADVSSESSGGGGGGGGEGLVWRAVGAISRAPRSAFAWLMGETGVDTVDARSNNDGLDGEDVAVASEATGRVGAAGTTTSSSRQGQPSLNDTTGSVGSGSVERRSRRTQGGGLMTSHGHTAFRDLG